MTFLKKLGQILANVVAVAIGVGPIIKPFLGSKGGLVDTAVNDLTQIGQVVVSVEAVMQAGAGPDKLKAAVPLVANILKTSEMLSGKDIANDALFAQGVEKITSGIADVLNSVSEKEAKKA